MSVTRWLKYHVARWLDGWARRWEFEALYGRRWGDDDIPFKGRQRNMSKIDETAMIVRGKQREALMALARIYDDDVSVILNALHELAARLAITSGVEPEH